MLNLQFLVAHLFLKNKKGRGGGGVSNYASKPISMAWNENKYSLYLNQKVHDASQCY